MFNIHEDTFPLVCYSRKRSGESEETWRTMSCGSEEILFTHYTFKEKDTESYIQGMAVVQPHRDFCGGAICSSASTSVFPLEHLSHAPVCADLNEVAGLESISITMAREFMKRSVAYSIVSWCCAHSKALLHWADKRDGQLSEVMEHLPPTMIAWDRPIYAFSGNVDPLRPSPYNQQGLLGTVPSYKTVIHSEVFSSPEIRNYNSGNTVASHTAVLDFPGTVEEYCLECDEYLEGEASCYCGWEAPPDSRRSAWVPEVVINPIKTPEWWEKAPAIPFYNG